MLFEKYDYSREEVHKPAEKTKAHFMYLLERLAERGTGRSLPTGLITKGYNLGDGRVLNLAFTPNVSRLREGMPVAELTFTEPLGKRAGHRKETRYRLLQNGVFESMTSAYNQNAYDELYRELEAAQGAGDEEEGERIQKEMDKLSDHAERSDEVRWDDSISAMMTEAELVQLNGELEQILKSYKELPLE